MDEKKPNKQPEHTDEKPLARLRHLRLLREEADAEVARLHSEMNSGVDNDYDGAA